MRNELAPYIVHPVETHYHEPSTLNRVYMDGFADDQCGSVDDIGHAYRVEEMIVTTDTLGHHITYVYASVADAERTMLGVHLQDALRNQECAHEDCGYGDCSWLQQGGIRNDQVVCDTHLNADCKAGDTLVTVNGDAVERVEIMRAAYSLLGAGDGSEWDENPEYTRAICELVADTCGVDKGDVLRALTEQFA